MYKFSIIIPIYNTEKYLEECIESVINQSYKNIEIILVNDGSPQNADEICRKYEKKDLRIKYFLKKNKGVSIARNFGISKATGDYIYCMDSDDTIEKDFIQKVADSIKKSETDLIIIGKWFCKKHTSIIGALPTCAFATKKTFLDKHPDIRFIEGIQPCEDGLFSHELLALTNKISKCPEAVYNYRKHENSSEQSIQTSKIIHDMPIWFEILEKFYDKYNLWNTYKLHLLSFIENEPYSLRFCKMNFSEYERKCIFDLIHNFIAKHNLLSCKQISLFEKKYTNFLIQNNYYAYLITTKNIVNKRIVNLIQKHNIISFDIFDTLLIRPYINPYHLLNHIENYTNCKEFAKNRFEAECTARQKSEKEDITLDEIYENLDIKYKHLKETELNFEYNLSKQNSHIFDIYNYAKSLGKKIVFISDMYLPKNFLVKVLAKNGYDYFDDFYLSGETGLAKYSGNLYKKFIQDYKINPSCVLHIGDSLVSDVQKPKTEGIHTYQVHKISDIYFANKHNQRFLELYNENKNSLEISIILALLAEKNMYSQDLFNNEHNYMYDFGYCIGGAIGYGFVKFILTKAKNNKYNQLLFVARDGYILKKIAEILSTEFETFYVYAQRILRSRMLLNYGDEHNADLLLSVIDENIPRTECLTTFENKKEYINKNINLMTEYANEKRKEYQQYLSALGIDKNKNIAVIDTGAATFSAQLLLENALNKKLHGFYSIITNPKCAQDNEISCSTWSVPEDIKNITSLIEFCFTSPELPVIDIKNGKPIYIKNPRHEELYRNTLYPDLSSGIIDFVQDIHNRLCGLEIEFSPIGVNKYIKAFCENLSHLDYKALAKVRSSSNASHTEYAHKFIDQISVSKRRNISFDKILSIKNEYSNNVKRKIITFLGIKIKIKQKI